MPNFSLPIRVYYEDTDTQGGVYYVNYLKYMERARTEWLRSLGVNQSQLDVVFVVQKANVEYKQPARLDDELTASLQVSAIKAAQIIFKQQILLNGQLVCAAEVAVVCVNRQTFTPCRLPAELRLKIQPQPTPN